MVAAVDAAKARVRRARDRWPLVDHAVRTQEHYSRVNGGAQAGAVTYYAFLSFFPLLALAFVVVGYVARVLASARDNLVTAVNTVLPSMVGDGQNGTIKLSTIQSAATAVGIVGLVALVYTGLGWLSGMRSALNVVFETPEEARPSFVLGKVRDLFSLVVIGLVLMLSVAVTGAVVGFGDRLLELVDLGRGETWLVTTLGVLVGGAADLLLFFTLFRLLARPRVPRRALWEGGLLGAVAFEVLKLASSHLLQATRKSPSFQAFGIALILLIWINYFSRVVMYAAAWAYVAPVARARRDAVTAAVPSAALTRRERPGAPEPSPESGPDPGPGAVPRPRLDPRLAFGAGMATALGLVAAVRRRRR